MTDDEIAATLALHGLVGVSCASRHAPSWEGVACVASRRLVCKYSRDRWVTVVSNWLSADELARATRKGVVDDARIADMPGAVLTAAYKVLVEGEPHDC